MKLGRLNHVGVATPSIEKSVALYRDMLGATKIHEPFDLPPQGVRVCFVDTPNSQIELIEPLGEADIFAVDGQPAFLHAAPDPKEDERNDAQSDQADEQILIHARVPPGDRPELRHLRPGRSS